MVLSVFASTVLRHLPLRALQVPPKEYHKFLGPVFSRIRNGRYYTTCRGNEPVDMVDVWKYLNFIVNEKPQDDQQGSEESQHVAHLLQNRRDLEIEIKKLENMSSEGDKELEMLIESEKKEFLESIKRIDDEMLSYILCNDEDDDDRDVELKLIPGIGGEEAKNFSGELLMMYMNYAVLKNWECLGDSESSSITVCGENVYGHLKYEAGVHRVQRVPSTESSGRIHTSTCSVVVLPQPKPHEIIIHDKDIIIEKLKSSGPGGQNVNKRETCVRIKHIPTGIVVENQTSRFQYENIKIAMQRLRGILYNMDEEKLKKERTTLRKEQAGTNDYSDKIRTYNFPQSRVTDHRIGHSTQNLKGFLSGKVELDDFIMQVREFTRRKELIYKIRNTLNSIEYKNFEKRQVG